MKTMKIRNGVLAVLWALPLACYAEGQADAIRKKLESEYQLTKTTDDKSDIVTAGSILLLHKDKVLMVAATSSANPCTNTYRDGRISPTKACGVGEKIRRLPGFGHVPGGGSAPATRNFVSGEKFWVTKIDVHDSGKEPGVILDFFTDATPSGDQGIRYKGVLLIPFGAMTPTPEEALKVVAEVITVVPPDDAKKDDKAQSAQGGQPGAAPPQPATPPPAAAPAEVAPEPIAPPPPPPADPVSVEVGQTIDQVVAALGQPQRKAKVGTKDIYFYKDLKVTFVNGKVKDVE